MRIHHLLAAIAATAAALVAAPAAEAGGPCRLAQAKEAHGSDITAGSAVYDATYHEGEPDLLGTGIGGVDSYYSDGTITVSIELAADSCRTIDYRVEVYDAENNPLLESTVQQGDGQSSALTLLNAAPLGDYSGSTVCVVVTTEYGGSVIDRAPNEGLNCDEPGSDPGQFWT